MFVYIFMHGYIYGSVSLGMYESWCSETEPLYICILKHMYMHTHACTHMHTYLQKCIYMNPHTYHLPCVAVIVSISEDLW